eukprot:COSAG05_NODE_18528_length_307_cov_0.658654_1_plen_32_part_10
MLPLTSPERRVAVEAPVALPEIAAASAMGLNL